MTRYARRRSHYATARAAWADVARRTGLRPHQVRAAHTAREYRWVKRS